MKITFFGAASEVTGSQHLIETDSRRILLDCGLFQGRRRESREKNEKFRCDPKNLDGVILSHAHIDHSGRLPQLCKEGYKGPIFCTRATADIAYIMLRDSAKIQQEDAKYLRRKLKKGHPPIEPLYGENDVKQMTKQLTGLARDEWHELADDFRVRFHNAGHILGSAIVEVELEDEGKTRRVIFSGDLGQRGMPLLKNPAIMPSCDVLICESTYGRRNHPPLRNIRGDIEKIVRRAEKNEGRVIIPAFSLGRTQLVLFILNNMSNDGVLNMPVFVDSPLSTRLTDVYRDYQEDLNDDVLEILKNDTDVFDFPELTFVRSREESMKLNRREGAFIVIASSGMCEHGRVVHHLKHAISHPANEICIIGYQASHTLGRRLVERDPVVRIYDRQYKLRANVEKVNGLSAHADGDDLKWWFKGMSENGGADNVFLVHGERESSEALAEDIRNETNSDPIIPRLYETFEV